MSADRSADSSVQVAIAHEWLVRYAGSERVVEELVREFPNARLLTTLLEPAELPIELRSAEPGLLQRVPGASSRHEWLLPLYPVDWRLRRPVAGVDAVITSSHSCVRGIRIARGIPHICYCHTPMRYAWDFDSEKERFRPALRPAARGAMAGFRRWDRRTAATVTRFVANSTAVAGRIRRFYGRDSVVVHPPVRTEFFTPGQRQRDDYLLFVGRLVSYKRADLAVAAAVRAGARLVVAGDGHLGESLRSAAPPGVTFVSSPSDSELRELYRGAQALLYPGEEDFGIVMAEAQACGTPIIALSRGGSLDIVESGRTGWLVHEQTVDAFARAIRGSASEALDHAEISASAQRFGAPVFRARMREVVEDTIRSRMSYGRPECR